MNREIKFRAWDRKMKAMAFVEAIWWNYAEGPKTFSFDGTNHALANTILMQYVGLKDKTGKEIYEGDILKWSFYDVDAATEHNGPSYEGGLAEVQYQEWTMAFRLSVTRFADENYMGADTFELWEDPELWTVEVVGNIYENPELLVRED